MVGGMALLSLDFITFGDGRSKYRRAASRIAREAQLSGCFSQIHALSAKDLPADFLHRHGKFVRENPKGFGYWLWKPYLLERHLKRSRADFILYCDAGNVLNLNGQTAERFSEYLVLSELQDFLLFEIDEIESEWCKRDTLLRLDPSGEHWQTKARESGTLLMTRSQRAHEIVSEWLSIACEYSYHFIDDTPSTDGEHESFIDHRHDQSILSLITKRLGITASDDDRSALGSEAALAPIWTARHRSGRTFQQHPTPLMRLAAKAERGLDRVEQVVRNRGTQFRS